MDAYRHKSAPDSTGHPSVPLLRQKGTYGTPFPLTSLISVSVCMYLGVTAGCLEVADG